MNMIISKRQIVLAALVLVLGAAIYVNWQLSDSNAGGGLETTELTNSEDNYGDAMLVDQPGDTSGDYFVQARLNRQLSRDEAVETLQRVLSDASDDMELSREVAAKASNIADCIESEAKIENLIKAKGFTECIAYVDTEKVNVVVKSEGLEAAQVSQIKDIIVTETKIPAENITIVEVK